MAGVGAIRVVAALALVAAAASLTGAQPGRTSEESFNGATCYSCHSSWSPVPMRTMFVLQPDTVEMDLGVPTEVGIGVQQAWVAKPPWPKLTHFEAFVDLANAPSIGFVSQQPPLLGVQVPGVIEPADNPLNDAEGHVSFDVPVGASDLVLTVAANSTDPAVGPDLVLLMFPGRSSPGTSPHSIVNAGGRGEPERFVVHGGRNITALSPDLATWTVQVRLNATARDPTTPSRELQLDPRRVPFTLTMDAYRNLTGETRQFIVVDRTVDAGQSTILPFRLRATGMPAPGEHVLATVNSTAYYPHTSGGGRDDWGNFSKTTRLEATAGPDGTVVLGPAQPAAVVAPASNLPLDRVSEAVGYMAGFLVLASIVSGGMLGKASRRLLNHAFGIAKRRVAFHNALSYFLILAAVVHTVLFLVEANYVWTLGILWGGIAILAMAGLGVTGAWQVAMVRRWGYGGWRWTHYGLAVAAIVFTLVHMALDGANFGSLQEAIGWEDPFPDPRQVR